MTWIDDRIAEREDRVKRTNAILQGAEKLFGELWAYVIEFTDEANQKGFSIRHNGTIFERSISMTVPIPPGKNYSTPHELHIKLEREKALITASGSNGAHVNMKLNLDTCKDDVICLKYNGAEMSVRDAAIAILDPFLFPQKNG